MFLRLKILRRFLLATKVLLAILCTGTAKSQEVEGSTFYKSQIDDLITIERVAVLPFVDNLDGIYARPLENHLLDLLKKDHHWDLIKDTTVGPLLSPVEITQDPARAKVISQSLNSANAFFAAKITKGPNGVSINLSMFLTKDSKLFAQQTIKNSVRFDIADLKDQMGELLRKIKKQIPYSGRILSRDGNRVTVNLGINDGVAEKQIIPVVQILKLNRHPKFQFLINTEKEILGKIKLLKIENTLSFGIVITEREKEAIQPGAKIAGIEFIEYGETDSLTGVGSTAGIGARPDKNISFGDNPKEWIPKTPPTFGRAAAGFGLGMFKASERTTTGLSYEATNPYYHSVMLDGELWLTNVWSMHFTIKQGIISIDNPGGSTPGELSQSLSKYDFMLGYFIRMGGGGIWDPWVELLAGYSSYRLFVDDSNPRTFTTKEYSGFKFGLKGQFPISQSPKWSAGAKVFIFWSPGLNETPVTSGSSNESSINEFGVFGGYRIKSNIQIFSGLDFELYSSSFSGNGSRTPNASSASHRHTVLNGGVNFFF